MSLENSNYDYMTIFKTIVQEAKKQIFSPEYQDTVTDQEVIGVIISKFGQWDGGSIFEIAKSAFEDSNFHSFNDLFEELWNKEEKRN